MANTTYTIVLKDSGIKAFTVPEGYHSDMEIHCWGAGGGGGRGAVTNTYGGYGVAGLGGGGGYAKTTINVSTGDEITFQIGQPGGKGGYPLGGKGGYDATYPFFRGGNAGNVSDEDADTGAGGGGGGASWVAVNGTVVCAGAGGGGAGGLGDDLSGGNPGLPGGVTTNGLNTNSWGGDSAGGGSSGGGGGAGYPLGGAAGTTYGDDAGNPPAGSGGQNYGNVTVAGSGVFPGGRNVSYYPGQRRGESGYPGYIVIILRKKLNILIKNPDASNTWVNVESLHYKLPTQITNVFNDPQAQSVALTTVGTGQWTVPPNVTSLTVTVIGGGGGGGQGCELDPFVSGGGGGGSGGIVTQTFSVTPGQKINYKVGAGGDGIAAVTTGGGGGGTGTAGESSWFVSDTTYVATGGGAARNSGSRHHELGGLGGLPNGVNGSDGVKINSDNGGPVAGGSGGGVPGRSTGGAGAPAITGESGSYGTGPGAGGGGGAGKGGGTVTQGGGANGKAGAILISYDPNPFTVTTVTGGWKQIQQVFTKVSGSWKPILTSREITLTNAPVRRVSANVSIVADTNDYNLFNSLPVTYFPGLMDITVWVYANVTIRGSNTLNAFLVDKFTSGDNIRVINYGRIQGRGGSGGAGGVYIAPTKFNSGTNSPGGAGGKGGGGLVSTIAITLENHGNIAGGGGGGGGGGVGFDNNWKSPSYTQGGSGGGGAGFGTGYNNGTLTSGGAGQNVSDPAGDGGSGGARGQAGARGANGTYNNGGVGGAAGPAIAVTDTVTYANVGTIIGPIWATVSGLL